MGTTAYDRQQEKEYFRNEGCGGSCITCGAERIKDGRTILCMGCERKPKECICERVK
jgi:hypothetical protein